MMDVTLPPWVLADGPALGQLIDTLAGQFTDTLHGADRQASCRV